MAWLVTALVVALLAVWAFYKHRNSTIYFCYPHGYTGFQVGSARTEVLQPVTRERYLRIVQRFLQGDLFDCLWISHRLDNYGGFVLKLEDGEIEMDVSFRSLKESGRIALFKRKMKSRGYTASDENGWNVGLGEELESVTLEYRLPADFKKLVEIVDYALEVLQGTPESFMFVQAWRSTDGPTGLGIKIRPKRDYLDEVL